jgi:tRNA nucleotidyltransferase (CCA-adding enzyme)
LGRPGLDFDLVVEGDAIAFARSISKKNGGKVTVHAHFGTASWLLDVGNPACSNVPTFENTNIPTLDFISARSETYTHPGALPTVKRGTLVDDLRRRDFTINTLALRLDGEYFGQLVDDLGGLDDLKKGLVRVLHPGSYKDDPTRILRAIRYEQRYGFQIAPEDLNLIPEAKSLLGGLSGERLRHELDLVLAEERSALMLTRLNELDIPGAIHPLLAWEAALFPLFESLNKPEQASWKDIPDLLHVPRRIALGYLLWLGQLTAAAIEELAARLDFTASLRDALLAYSALQADLPVLAEAKPSVVTTRLDKVPLLAVCAASLAVNSPTRIVLGKYLSDWRHVKAKTTGRDLVKRGLPPGPAYQVILSRLRAAWLDGELKTNEDELTLLDKLTKLV